MHTELTLIRGGSAVDDRGTLQFVNDFDFAGVKRFYAVSNHAPQFTRAWHAHRNEGKYVTVLTGAAIIGAVQIDNWEAPSKTAKVTRMVLSAANPAVLFIPPGYANGFRTLTPNTTVVFFSTSTLAESMGDDIRYPADYWNPWGVEER